MDRTVEVSATVVFQSVFQMASLAGEESLHKQFVLLQRLFAFHLVVVFVEIPAIVHGRVAQLHI